MWRCSHGRRVQLVIVGIWNWNRSAFLKRASLHVILIFTLWGSRRAVTFNLTLNFMVCINQSSVHGHRRICCSLLCEFPNLVIYSILVAISIKQHNSNFLTDDHHQYNCTMIIRLFVHLSYKYKLNCTQSTVRTVYRAIFSFAWSIGGIWTECLIKMKWNS